MVASFGDYKLEVSSIDGILKLQGEKFDREYICVCVILTLYTHHKFFRLQLSILRLKF